MSDTPPMIQTATVVLSPETPRTGATATPEHLSEVARFFEALSPADLPGLGAWYTEDAFFKDPFNEVTGLPAVRGIFHHMYQKLDDPRFRVLARIGQGDQAFLTWTFEFRFRGEARSRSIRGATHLVFAQDGRIRWHRDYWDAAEELYEQLPLLGSLMRWLKRQANR